MFSRNLIVRVAIFATIQLGASVAIANPKEWSEREAIAEAQHDIRAHKVKFYWHGGYASMPIGVPTQYYHLADSYPHADGGTGCIVSDQALRERQGKYSETYNKLMLKYVLQRQ